MDIIIRAHHTTVSDDLRALASEKLAKIDRFAGDVYRVEVDFSEERNPRIHERQVCEATVRLRKVVIKAHASGHEQVVALDRLVDKVEHQLQKLHSKRVSRTHPRRRDLVTHALPVDDLALPVEPDEEGRVVKVKKLAIEAMSTDEAALQMDLLGHDFFVFTNVDTGRTAVMYRRQDGHLGLIDTEPTAGA
ncbi:MAG: ribosome hibernation-promoting factor, HPF/YfiA family [Acidimicrobiia bacterium]